MDSSTSTAYDRFVNSNLKENPFPFIIQHDSKVYSTCLKLVSLALFQNIEEELKSQKNHNISKDESKNLKDIAKNVLITKEFIEYSINYFDRIGFSPQLKGEFLKFYEESIIFTCISLQTVASSFALIDERALGIVKTKKDMDCLKKLSETLNRNVKGLIQTI